MIVWNRELDAHQGCFNAADNQENEGVHDVHQAELLVIHRRQPLIHHVQRRAALLNARHLIDSLDCMSCAHETGLSHGVLAKLREICGDNVKIVIVQMHCRHQRPRLH